MEAQIEVESKANKFDWFEENRDVLERDYRVLELSYVGVFPDDSFDSRTRVTIKSEIGPGFRGDKESGYLIRSGSLTVYSFLLLGAFGHGRLLTGVCERFRAKHVKRLREELQLIEDLKFDAGEGADSYDQMTLCRQSMVTVASPFVRPFDQNRLGAMMLGFATRQTADVPDEMMSFIIEASKPVKRFKVGDKVTAAGVEYQVVGSMLGGEMARFACSRDGAPEVWFDLEELELAPEAVEE